MVYPYSLSAYGEEVMLTRNRCIANTLIMFAGAGVSVAFAVMLRLEKRLIAGILEWIVGGLGAAWIFTFVGVLRFVKMWFLCSGIVD